MNRRRIRTRIRTRSRILARLLAQRLARVGTAFAFAFFATAAASYALERDVEGTHIRTFGDAVWLCVVTLATVGYGDVYPITPRGRAVLGLFILFVLVSVGFLLTAVNEAVLEVKRMEDNGLIGTDLTGHVVLYGWSPVARTAAEELLAAGRAIAWVVERTDDISAAQRLAPRDRLFVTSGELTQDLLGARLNAAAADTVVIASSDDARNIVASLNARAVNPGARIIVAVQAEALRQTLIASGVTYVASPFELSGRLVASAAFEPEVAQFIEDVTSGVDDGFDLRQYGAAPFAERTVRDVRAELAGFDGPLLVGLAVPSEKGFRVHPNPPGDRVIGDGDQLVVLTDRAQAERFTARYKTSQGR